ncbi:hypothetical protein IMG5_200950 [Ichthyophthirius multifiliis]|uniref:Transmembrane protein n=1 Tax=Ichthyophthirius multifiliis TaxID=5932 RepID=G0R5T4_ICHMU|nr:hypothetical protein IMG5_200950 [Ichthyophthirius multifiliis]EGR27155.1 hypothetical protein IMG5_200950 [Ichthyophthirius multifiliis]|eukprot:XP_004024039.1 hypothetical protein IMG5_200950 [Ichthyophthirius multifiliis]
MSFTDTFPSSSIFNNYSGVVQSIVLIYFFMSNTLFQLGDIQSKNQSISFNFKKQQSRSSLSFSIQNSLQILLFSPYSQSIDIFDIEFQLLAISAAFIYYVCAFKYVEFFDYVVFLQDEFALVSKFQEYEYAV